MPPKTSLRKAPERGDKDGSGPTRKRVRPLTEARKVQNRLAQRAYRERQKARLQCSGSDGVGVEEPVIGSDRANQGVEADPTDLSWLPDLEALESGQYIGLEDSDIFADILASPSAFHEDQRPTRASPQPNVDLPFLLADFRDLSANTVGSLPQGKPIDPPLTDRCTFEEYQKLREAFTDRDPSSGFGETLTTEPPVCTYSNEPGIRLMPIRRSDKNGPFQPNPPSPSRPSTPASPPARKGRKRRRPVSPKRWDYGFDYQSLNILTAICEALGVEGVEENYDLLKYAIIEQNVSMNEILSAGLRSVLGGTPETTAPLLRQALRLPDPRATNGLRFVRASTLTSYLFNARALDLNVRDLVQDGCLSPFHRQSISPSDDPKVIQESFNNNHRIPEHLRPTLPQIMYPHHPYLDLLPFPTFRARAIALGATTPPMYDMLELKHDVMSNGLVCWRTPEGSPHGQPWDMRNWEVAPWFFRKWRMLLGGEDGEIWTQSLWWQRMRGEEAKARLEVEGGVSIGVERPRATTEDPSLQQQQRPYMPVEV